MPGCRRRRATSRSARGASKDVQDALAGVIGRCRGRSAAEIGANGIGVGRLVGEIAPRRAARFVAQQAATVDGVGLNMHGDSFRACTPYELPRCGRAPGTVMPGVNPSQQAPFHCHVAAQAPCRNANEQAKPMCRRVWPRLLPIFVNPASPQPWTLHAAGSSSPFPRASSPRRCWRLSAREAPEGATPQHWHSTCGLKRESVL